MFPLYALAAIRVANKKAPFKNSTISILLRSLRNRKKFLKDRNEFYRKGTKYFNDWSVESDDFKEKILRSLSLKKGVVIGSCFSSIFHPVFKIIGEITDSCLLMMGSGQEQAMPATLLMELEEYAGLKIRICPVGPESAIALARHLSKNGVVLTMIDTCLPNMETINIPYFGAPTKTLSGLYLLCVRFESPIIPCIIDRKKRGIYLRSGKIISTQYPRETAELRNSASLFASNVMQELESLIRVDPSVWWQWAHLYIRWGAAILR